MRLICTIDSDETNINALEFSYFLTSQGISNDCEQTTTDAGLPCYRVWIYDEDLVEQARNYYEEYKRDPKDPRYRAHYENAIRIQQEKLSSQNTGEEASEEAPNKKRNRILSPAPYGPVSILILLMCIGLFVWAQLHRGEILPPKIPGIIQAPSLSPIEKALIYDYPLYFQLRDKLLSLYTKEDIEKKIPPSQEARHLVSELRNTPVWMGIYDRIVTHFKNKESPISYHGPLFEKISQGEVWRIFTPAFLHFDLLHIFFNILWFVLLGNQIEYRIGKGRYILLILATAILSNTGQYLMSGPFFMGLSGIVVGMAGFIFARQQVAPWEGYLLHRLTFIFLALFVVGMFALQLVFFFMQVFGKFELTIGIANTAHLVGGVVGYLLGRTRFFSLKH